MSLSAAKALRRQAYASIALAGISVLACAGLMIAVALAPAPAPVIPLAVLLCIGCPLVMAWPVPSSIYLLRATRRVARHDHEHALRTLRRHLASLPEREHPLGL